MRPIPEDRFVPAVWLDVVAPQIRSVRIDDAALLAGE
jgi:hypothetical protein